MSDFADRIRYLRNQYSISQRELAKEMGVTASSISAYEGGTRSPTHNTLKKLAVYFNVSTDYLVGLDDRKTADSPDHINISHLTAAQKDIIYSIVHEFTVSNENDV